MRLLIVIPHFMIGGAQRLLSDLVPLMARRDDLDITLALYQKPDGARMLAPILRNPMVKIKVLDLPINHSALLNPAVRYKAVSRLRALMKNADVCHVHLFPALYDAALAARGLPVKLVFTNHNTTNRRRRFPFLRLLERKIYARYQEIACISPAAARSLSDWLNLAPTDNRISVVANGINPDLFNFRTFQTVSPHSEPSLPDSAEELLQCFYAGLDADRRRRMDRARIKDESEVFHRKGHAILMISRFVANKDQDSLIKALALLKHDSRFAGRVPDDTFIAFVGSGPRMEDCKRLAQELKIESDVVFLGDRYDLPRLIAASTVGAQISHWEGFGLTACEILAGELPLIASRVNGMAQIVKDGALLVEPGSPESIAEGIAEILTPSTPESFNDLLLRQTAGKGIAQRHHIRYTLDRYLDLYSNSFK